jgi:hypothetical protein
MKHADGWSADTQNLPRVFHYNPFDEDESENQQIDPLQQQIVIIKG